LIVSNWILNMSKFSAALLIALVAGFSPASASAAKCEAAPFIESAGGAFTSAARQGSAGAFANAASRYTDLNGIAMFALGSYRGQLKKSQQGEYIALTRGFIGRFMAENASSLAGKDIIVKDCSGSKDSMVVNTQLSNGKKIVFKVYKTRGGYRVRDVNVSSVWMAQQLRSKFTGVIRRGNGDIAELFDYLRN
jgi:phospholipid transport system substrate-binding protein